MTAEYPQFFCYNVLDCDKGYVFDVSVKAALKKNTLRIQGDRKNKSYGQDDIQSGDILFPSEWNRGMGVYYVDEDLELVEIPNHDCNEYSYLPPAVLEIGLKKGLDFETLVEYYADHELYDAIILPIEHQSDIQVDAYGKIKKLNAVMLPPDNYEDEECTKTYDEFKVSAVKFECDFDELFDEKYMVDCPLYEEESDNVNSDSEDDEDSDDEFDDDSDEEDA